MNKCLLLLFVFLALSDEIFMKIIASFYFRFCVQPNDGFEQQLREFEAIYRARVEVAIEKKVFLVCLQMRSIQSAGCAKGCCEWASSKEREGGGGCR